MPGEQVHSYGSTEMREASPAAEADEIAQRQAPRRRAVRHQKAPKTANDPTQAHGPSRRPFERLPRLVSLQPHAQSVGPDGIAAGLRKLEAALGGGSRLGELLVCRQ